MIVEDILVKIRSRLKDEDYNDLRFSDDEIIDNLNNALSYLIGTYDFNLQTKITELNPTHKDIKIPSLLKIKKAYFNNKVLNTRTNIQKSPTEPLSLFIHNELISVTPFKEGELKLIYNEFVPLKSPEEKIDLPFFVAYFLVYGTLCNILEVNTQDENYNKIGFFLNLKKTEENNIVAAMNRIYCNDKLQSKVIMI
ncbi:hypothetical protein [Helicobacter labetoulli]|uniref:hypothetical protein n=1 Tax=Helicobacter labetoulli TaxID=2315333 RepID=UPI0013002F94|nr:hypothetical protein [Helicobacter labetoulli]